jgi:GNAT superfamily N-acetyltransferase
MLSPVHFRDPRTFLNRIRERIGTEEVRYNLILGVSSRLLDDLHEYGQEDPWFVTVEEEDGVFGLALRTPPFEILVAAFPGDLAEISGLLAAEASSAFDVLPGVVGEPNIADLFACEWCTGRGVEIKQTMRQRVYGLTEVKPIPLSPGTLRRAGIGDKELVGRWVAGFQEDTFGHVDEDRVVERAAKMLERGDVYLWVDGDPVSIAARTRPTGDVITIGMVYTPPRLRKRGYASSCVATLCGRLLRSGFKHCALYTDLSNPTSNKIYKQIGFTEVCDSISHTFTG